MRKAHFALAGLVLFSFLSFGELKRRILDPDYLPPHSKKIKIAYFDADSTLRVAPSGNVSANTVRDVWILPGVSTEIARLAKEGYLIAIVSNQGGVPKNITLENADGALDFVRKMVRWLNPEANIHYFDFAEKYDGDRKPGTGMMERLEKLVKEKFGEEYSVDKAESFMCGDSAYKKGQVRPDGKEGTDFSSSDREVAENHGIRFIDPAEFFHWKEHGVERFTSKEQIDQYFEKFPELKLPVSGPCPFPSLVKKPDPS